MKELIKTGPDQYKIGERIQTRGNDEEYPTFELEDGTRQGVRAENVVRDIQDGD